MYAVIETGSKQYRVQPGDTIDVETLPGELKTSVELNNVLLVANDDVVRIGTPAVQGVKVIGEILVQDRDKKIIVFKFKRRKSYARTRGHRQSFTRLKIKEFIGL